jgi:hypothetical protein
MTNSTSDSTSFAAKASVILSSICVVHCMAVPVVLLLAPAISTFFSDTLEWWLTVGILPLAAVGFIPTWWQHKNRMRLAQFVTAMTIIILAQTVFHVDHEVIESTQAAWISLETLSKSTLSLIGASLLAWVTYKNNRHTHVCTNHHHAGHH